MTGIGRNPDTDQLQDLLLESKGLPDFVLGLMLMSVSLLGGQAPLACSITLQRGTALARAASNSADATRLDLVQQELDEGPSLEALRSHGTVFAQDLQADNRWTRFSSTVQGEGMRSVLAVSMAVSDSVDAVLSCYSSSSEAFDDAVIHAVQETALSVSRALQTALSDPRGLTSEKWRTALQSRAVVDGAVALIMAQERCSRAEALILLYRGARTTNQTLLEEAGKVIHGRFPGTT